MVLGWIRNLKRFSYFKNSSKVLLHKQSYCTSNKLEVKKLLSGGHGENLSNSQAILAVKSHVWATAPSLFPFLSVASFEAQIVTLPLYWPSNKRPIMENNFFVFQLYINKCKKMYAYKILQAYLFWAHICYLLIEDLSKRAEKGKVFLRCLTILKPGIILLGSQVPHSPVIFKTKIQLPTQPQVKTSPRNSIAGVYFSYPLSTILDTAIKLMMERESKFQITSHFCYSGRGQCQLLWQFYCLFYEPNWTCTNLHRRSESNYSWLLDPMQGLIVQKGEFVSDHHQPSHPLSVSAEGF